VDIEGLPAWDDWSSYYTEEAPHDGVERPPLTGKKRYVPQGLYDQPWDKVKDAYGAATLTPYYIEALTSDDDGDVSYGVYWLYAATTHQGSVYKASKMAVPFLADIARNDYDGEDAACHFLARIALGEENWIHTPAGVYHSKYYAEVKKHLADIQACYERWGSDEAMRLLCFLPGGLPEQLDLSYDAALVLEAKQRDPDAAVSVVERHAYARQASLLLAQGFIAAERNYQPKGYPRWAGAIDLETARCTGHLEAARALMESSPSLLVRGAAAVCLAYSGAADADVKALLLHIGRQDFRRVPWAWDEDFSRMVRRAWYFAASIDDLVDTVAFPDAHTYNDVSNRAESLLTAAERIFPPKFPKFASRGESEEAPSIVPSELTGEQRRVLERLVELEPRMFDWRSHHLNVPQTLVAAKRLLEQNDSLSVLVGDVPLWFVLERAAIEGDLAAARAALANADVMAVLAGLFVWEQGPEQVTLNLINTEKVQQERLARLCSILADALAGYETATTALLDKWLPVALERPKYRSTAMPVITIGICLLSLARQGKLPARFEPLAVPDTGWRSLFPVPLMQEVLAHTSPQHQRKVGELL
jgi:hypothetical protein